MLYEVSSCDFRQGVVQTAKGAVQIAKELYESPMVGPLVTLIAKGVVQFAMVGRKEKGLSR